MLISNSWLENLMQVDPYLVTLMSLILLLNPDFYALKNRQNMEDLQLKYILILQRYLK